MNILALVGSHRKKGNTAQIVEMIAARLNEFCLAEGETLQFETIYLGHREIRVCRGCRVCFDQGEAACPLEDDLLEIKARMQAADGILLATPVYVNDVNGTVKNCIDRLAHVCHRPEFAGKTAGLVATVGLGPTSHALRTMSMALSSWGFHIAAKVGFKMGALMEAKTVESTYGVRVVKLAAAFYRAIQRDHAADPSFLSLMTFRIQQGYWLREPQPGSVDYQYWQSQGWVDPGQDYYTQHKAGRLKVGLARLAGAALAPFVT